MRHAELVETQRREEKDRRHCEEKERRMAQQRQRVKDEKETQQKIAARAFAQVGCCTVALSLSRSVCLFVCLFLVVSFGSVFVYIAAHLIVCGLFCID